VGLDADDLELWMALEHPAEDERAHHVLAAADNRHEAVQLRSARAPEAGAALDRLLRSQDVERQRQAELDRRIPEFGVDRAIVILDSRVAGHHHAPETHRLDLPQVLDSFRRRSHRSLPAAEKPLGLLGAVLGEPEVVSVEASL